MLWLLLILINSTAAPAWPQITAVNVAYLQPVDELRLPTSSQQGWFILGEDGSEVVLHDRAGGVWHYTIGRGLEQLYTDQPMSLAAGVIRDGVFYGVHNLGETIRIYRASDAVEVLDIDSSTPAVDFWVMEDGSYAIERVSAPTLIVSRDGRTRLLEADFTGSMDVVVRIGRIPAPYAVTSTEDGQVILWHWPTNEQQAAASNGTGQPSVFGNINASASHLVWRDNENSALYLLDFVSGENRLIAPLNGEYVQWFFLGADASVVLGVNVEFAPIVAAWDVTSGMRLDLGSYLPCERPQPDMARLSADGTTLVIGCDAGLQFWRVQRAEPPAR
jgi:hypothetical protein